MYKLALHIFPILQTFCFITALFLQESHFTYSLLLLFCTALFLNFSLHITIHHFVHFTPKNKVIRVLLELIYSILLALPYSFYRMQHFNHHRYNNKIGDFTSTWEKKKDIIYAKPFFKYTFLWFLNGSMKALFHKAISDGDLNTREKTKIRVQFLLILAMCFILIILNPLYALAYVLMFYIGWSLIALTNYGQHLPVEYDSTPAYSYHNSFYNSIFFNNGLHLEHHLEPHLNYPDLKPMKQSKIAWPHLIIVFFRKK